MQPLRKRKLFLRVEHRYLKEQSTFTRYLWGGGGGGSNLALRITYSSKYRTEEHDLNTTRVCFSDPHSIFGIFGLFAVTAYRRCPPFSVMWWRKVPPADVIAEFTPSTASRETSASVGDQTTATPSRWAPTPTTIRGYFHKVCRFSLKIFKLVEMLKHRLRWSY